MIQANELRTENLVLKEGLIYEIYSVNTEGEIQLYKSDEHTKEGIIIDCQIDDIKPIELTEEILLKCGFEKNASSYSKMIINFIDVEINIESEITWIKERKVNHIKHLHQLQNLIHAITGEELEINL